MNPDRRNAVIVGVLFIMATISAIIGLALYAPILNNPDFLLKGSENAARIIWGAISELILACSAVGTSIMLFPYLKRHNESIAIGYVTFRLFEAVVIVIGLLSLLSLLTLSQKIASGMSLDLTYLQASDALFRAIHTWSFIIGPNFFLGINTMLYSYSLYRTKLVPRPLAAMGMIGAILIFIAAILEMFGVFLQISPVGIGFAITIGLFEMILAVWLIVRGFNLSFAPGIRPKIVS